MLPKKRNLKNHKMSRIDREANSNPKRQLPFSSRIRNVITSLTLALIASASLYASAASIDVLIVYTPAVKAVYSDHDGVLAKAQEIIAKANLGFDNSLVDAAFNLVHVEEIAYTESVVSYGEDLDAITDEDGVVDNVLTLRDIWGADLVCLLRNGSIGGTAGLGWILEEASGLDSTGLSVVSVQSSVSGNTFAHETGHNLGAAHDADNSGINDGLFLYSHGHHFDVSQPNSHRTIMAYQKDSNTQVNYFSNPNVNYLGVVTGVAEGNANPADNAKTFTLSTPFVADYRDNQTDIPSFPSPFPSFAFVEGQSRTLLAQAVGTPNLSYQWYEGTSGDTSAPLGGATNPSFTTPTLNQTSVYWVRATNPNGSGDSPSIVLSTTAAPSESNVFDQNHNPDDPNDFFQIFSVANGVVWQEFIPSVSYLHAIELRIWKNGTPGRMSLKFTDENSVVLYSKIYEEGDITSNFQWLNVPLQVYVDTGKTYRISLQRLDNDNPSDSFSWQSTDWASDGDSYPAGSSNQDNGAELHDYYFRSSGSDASPPTASIDPTEKTIADGAATYDITVTASDAWTANEALDWLSLSPSNGSGNGTVTVTVEANSSSSERSGFILVGNNNHAIVQQGINQGLDFSQWLLGYYTSEEIAALSPSASEADPDGDGVNNSGEFLLQLDPTSLQSRPNIVATNSENGIVITISPKIAGVAYRLNKSDNLISWTPSELTPNTDGDSVVFTIPAGSEAFFQLEIEATP